MDEQHSETRSGLFPIRTVAGLTGVNPITLRAWERRYGLLKPLRTEKGHRLYTQADIDLINRIVEQLEKGISISQVKPYLDGAAPETGSQGPWGSYQQRMLNAVVRFDDQLLDAAYNEALSLHPIDLVTQRLILPLLKTLGQRWAGGEGSVAEEHFFGVYLRNKLGARFHHEASRARGPRLVAACLPGEHHEVGLLLFCLSLMAHGYRVVLLGGDTPLSELMQVVQRSQAIGVVLSGSTMATSEVLHTQLPALVEQLAAVPLFIGGQTALLQHDAITSTGAIALGIDMAQALKHINARFALRS